MQKSYIILIIVIAVVVVAVAVTLLAVFLTKDNNKYIPNSEVEIMNSYDNTEELIQKFPVKNPTYVNEGIEKSIQNRLLTGFENWNRGFEAWKKWGDILYTQESIYNVHGTRLTLAQYQEAMNNNLKQANIQMGGFYNMLIVGEFTAIRYDFSTIIGEMVRPGTVMEFVKFKDYGDELGTRVVEGWGGTKDNSGEAMSQYQGEEERVYQNEQEEQMRNYNAPTQTQDCYIKYPINYETDIENRIQEIILNGIIEWNKGLTNYFNWLDSAYDTNAESYGLNDEKRTMSQYRSAMTQLINENEIKKLYFDNILIRDYWAAIHYRYRKENISTGDITVGDRMQFLKFEEKESSLKIVGSWIQ